MNIRRVLYLSLVILLFAAGLAQAVLFRVGPLDNPSPPGNGFPFWYQDTRGLALDLCLPANHAQLDAGVCLILPPDQDPAAGINLPLVFPSNFPDEAFWWNASTLLELPGGNRAVLVLALEAAFGTGVPAAGDQISFGRVRIIVDAPVGATYTVTHPFGQKIFPGVEPGKRAITFTSDIGIGAPGDFSGALSSEVGPFLVAADAPGGTPAGYFSVPGDTSGDLFLSDTLTPVPVTGSPTGSNYFEICVDALANGLDGLGGPSCARIDVFTLMGKVHRGAIGSPLAVDQATYSRTLTSAHVDVFATASPGPGAPTPMLSFGDAAGVAIPSVLMKGPASPLNRYYGQAIPFTPTELPAGIIVTNVADSPPSSVKRNLTDAVRILQAGYNAATQELTLTATSSDKTAPPQLTAIGLPGTATGSALLVSTGNPADPAEAEVIVPVGQVPPAIITVVSNAGGSDTEPVAPVQGGTFQPGAPVAVDDVFQANAGLTQHIIPVLQNDAGFDPATVRIVTGPTNGTATVNQPTGTVTFSPSNPAFVGDSTFSYTVRSSPAGFESNVATVTVTTIAPPGGAAPIANPDGPFTALVNQTISINVANLLANDNPNGSIIDPASFEIVPGSVAGGTAVAAAGTVSFTAGAVAGSGGFSYTVASSTGQRSAPAAVSITILPVNDTLTIAKARWRPSKNQWIVEGTSTVPGAANTVTVTLIRNNVTIAIIGSTPVTATGAWTLNALNTGVVGQAGDQVRATSTAGGTVTSAIRIN